MNFLNEALVMSEKSLALLTKHKAANRRQPQENVQCHSPSSEHCQRSILVKMADNKRKHETDSTTDELYSNKSRSRPSATARLDPTYGQRSAFPVDEEGEEDGETQYDDDMDALAYLKSVRLVNSCN